MIRARWTVTNTGFPPTREKDSPGHKQGKGKGEIHGRRETDKQERSGYISKHVYDVRVLVDDVIKRRHMTMLI